jgi:hypothetical protein
MKNKVQNLNHHYTWYIYKLSIPNQKTKNLKYFKSRKLFLSISTTQMENATPDFMGQDAIKIQAL